MRSIWSGALSFGLINIPVNLYSAVNEKELPLHFLHKEDLSPIRFAKVCRSDGREVAHKDLVKGYEYQKGDYIVLTDEDFKAANPKRVKSIEISGFVDEKEVDSIYFEKPYYLEASKDAEKPYILLREALKKSKKIGIAKYVLRNKEHLGAIRPEGNLLILNQMKFKDEVRNAAGLNLPEAKNLNEKELQMAIQLIEQLTGEFKPEDFKDTYTSDLKKVIEEKAKGHVFTPTTQEPQYTKVADLMEILKQSLEQERQKSSSKNK